MRYAKKYKPNPVHAYELGAGTEMERLLREKAVICLEEDGSYRLFSKEAVNGVGELARPGDYFKVEQEGERYYAYPNCREWFLRHHTPLGGDLYQQHSEALPIWRREDPPCEAVEALLAEGVLQLHPEDTEHYFRASLHGAPLSAAEDAVLVFHELTRDGRGTIRDLQFDFIERKVFDQYYTLCETPDGA